MKKQNAGAKKANKKNTDKAVRESKTPSLEVNSYATNLFKYKLAQVQNEMRELGIIQAC